MNHVMKRPRARRLGLLPLGALFGAAAAFRAALYRFGLKRQHRLSGPVISVGNLSLGGSGKTPVVARLAEMLRDEGLPVAILSRGYGGAFRGDCLIVSDGEQVLADAATAGDEPVMLARALPRVVVAVGPRRDLVGRAVEARFGRRVHLLDDGFQHLRLARDLDILCIDAADLDEPPLPAGRLREWRSAVTRADVVLLGTDQEMADRRSFEPAAVFRFGRRTTGFVDLDGRPAPAPAKAFLLAGIARPERFEIDVRALCGPIAGRRFFRDHHRFSRADLDDAVVAARASGADAIVTTAKDAVRLPPAPPDFPVRVLGVAVQIDDESHLRRRVLAVARGTERRRRLPRHAYEALAAWVTGALVRSLPRRWALAFGRGVGRVLGDLDRRHVRIAIDNLERAFPHWDRWRVLRTARAVYAHFGETLIDILWLEGRTPEQVLSLVEVVGREHAEAAMKQGRGVIWATAHFGNWEVNGLAHGWLSGPMGVVARPLDNPDLDRRLCAFRAASGNTIIYKRRALPDILRLLGAGRSVGILVDQNVQEEDGIFVEFFGRPAASTTVAAALAVKTGCPLATGYAERLSNGGYRLVYEPALEWVPSGNRLDDIARLTQALARRIEDWIRRTPEQWLWIHRRWKTQPRPEGA